MRSELLHAGRASRRELLKVTGLGVASLASLASLSCGGTSSTAQRSGSPTDNAAPSRGGTLTVAHFFNRGFDPHVLQATDTGIMGLFYSALIRSNPSTYELEPDLAVKWELPSQ